MAGPGGLPDDPCPTRAMFLILSVAIFHQQASMGRVSPSAKELVA
jgi:hypothetical protein